VKIIGVNELVQANANQSKIINLAMKQTKIRSKV